MVPMAGLPAAVRCSGGSMPWATQLRSRCSKAGIMRSSMPRSISMVPPRMFSRTCLPISLEVWRTTAYRRSARESNSTMRVRSRSRCSSRAWRPWATRSSSAPAMSRCRLRCTVATSLTDSAIMRVSSCTRVKRSNSSGSKPAAESLDRARRDCIWLSAWTSMSRSCMRRRSRLPASSSSEPRAWARRASTRERAISTSPAWLIRRSSNWARTRTVWWAPARSGAVTGAGCASAGAGDAPAPEASEAVASEDTAEAAGSAWSGPSARPSGPSCTCSPATRSTSKPACNASKLPSKGSICSAVGDSLSTRSTADSSRWAISPRRMAPASRALPLRVCRARSVSWRASSREGRPCQRRSAAPRRGSSSMASSSKMGNRSGSTSSRASMSSSRSLPTATAWAMASSMRRCSSASWRASLTRGRME